MPHGVTAMQQEAILRYLAGQRPWPELTAADFAAPTRQPGTRSLNRSAPRRQYLPITEPSAALEGLIADAVATERVRPPRVGIAAFKSGDTPPFGVPNGYHGGSTQWGGTQPWRIRPRKG